MSEKDQERMAQLKEEYEQMEVPLEAKERIMAGIMMAKKEEIKMKKNKNKMIPFAKGSVITCAAAMATIVVLANADVEIAMAMEQIPVIGAITRVVTFRNYSDKTNNFVANVDIPKVELESSGDGESGIGKNVELANKTIEEYAMELIDEYEADLKKNEGEGNYALDSTYEVIRDDERYLSIRINTVFTMASGNQMVKIFNIDKETGNILSMEDVFEDGVDYLGIMTENIKEQMKAAMEKDETKSYFLVSEGEDAGFDKLTGEENFYFNDNGEIVIAFNEYDVAPGYMGAVEFTIPKDVIAPKQ